MLLISLAPQTHLSEDGGLVKRGEGRVEKRKRVLVLDRDVVYSPVVHTGSQGLVLLLHKEEPGPTRGKEGRMSPFASDSEI